MNKYTYDFVVGAQSENDADRKMTALQILASRLNVIELERLAQVVEKEPMKLAIAKKALGL
jgi:hypothetical protein